MWPGYASHMGGMWLWWIVALAVLLVLIWAVSRMGRPGDSGRSEDSPETVLKRRYANGDIDRDEYERRLVDLRR